MPIRGRRRSLLMKPAVDLSKLIENCQKRSWLSLVFGEKCPSPKKTSVAEKSPSPRKNRRTSFGRRAVQISTQQEKHSSLNLSQQTTKGCRKTFGDYKKNLSARFYTTKPTKCRKKRSSLENRQKKRPLFEKNRQKSGF